MMSSSQHTELVCRKQFNGHTGHTASNFLVSLNVLGVLLFGCRKVCLVVLLFARTLFVYANLKLVFGCLRWHREGSPNIRDIQ